MDGLEAPFDGEGPTMAYLDFDGVASTSRFRFLSLSGDMIIQCDSR